MTDYKVGDRVRISYEGVIEHINKYGEPRLDDGMWFYVDGSTGVGDSRHKYIKGKIEILERAKPKVGDKFNSRRDLAALPDGSIVENDKGSALIVKDGCTTSVRTGFRLALYAPATEAPPYTVIHLPS